MDTLINMKNNLIQNFYIVGLSPEEFLQFKENNKAELLNIFGNTNNKELIPKMISKFPPKNSNFNGINDKIIVNHCFPNGLKIVDYNNNLEGKKRTTFYFELDNFLFNYTIEEKNIFSKLYFTCLEIYEPLTKYFNYKNDVIELFNKKIEVINDVNQLDEKCKNIFIPKIICFSTILPFYREMRKILITIYRLYSNNLNNNYIIPLEKLIEQIVLSIPIPLMSNTHLELLFNINDPDNYLLNSNSLNKIVFPLFNIRERNIQHYYTNPIIIFRKFNVDDVIKIFKYILLEIPILFFSDDKSILSCMIENFLSLLSPFKYMHPHISLLPRKLYGLIGTENKFLFGINEKYNYNFFKNNNIEIDKKIVIINVNESKIEEIMKDTNEMIVENDSFLVIEEDDNKTNEQEYSEGNYVRNDYVMYNFVRTELTAIELPCSKKDLNDDLVNYLNKKGQKDEDEFNYKIKNIFYKFFVFLLEGYNDYLLNSKCFYDFFIHKNCGNELLYKKNNEKGINDLNFIKEIFKYEEYLIKFPKDQLFYFVFFQTKMFINFLRERIYVNDKINSIAHKQFDQLTFLKSHKNFRKKEENKGVYEELKKKPQVKTKKEAIKEVCIVSLDFSKDEEEQLINKGKQQILLKYAQYIASDKKKEKDDKNKNDITTTDNKILIDYPLFPKLLFDDECFNMNYDNLFFMHGIDLPNRVVEEYKIKCISFNENNYKNRNYMFPPKIFEQLPSTNRSKVSFDVTSYNYIYYNWIILLCCSLWYCEPIERIIRLNEILIKLDKLDCIEEIVLKLLFKTFLKYGTKNQCIKIHKKMTEFYGHSNYLYLNLLCNKLCEKESEINNLNENFKQYMKYIRY